MIGKWEREERFKKLDRKVIWNALYKNRFLILSCLMLILGTFFGTSMLKIIPEELSENLFGFVSKSSSEFINIFINRFSFPFIILFGIYLSGTCILGNFTAPAAIFINGFFFGFENALNFKFTGMDHVVSALVIFFTSAVFIDFILLIMSENSIYSSRQLSKCVSNKNDEKPHYNAKNLTVKFIGFTAVFAIICLISAVFYKFIHSVL